MNHYQIPDFTHYPDKGETAFYREAPNRSYVEKGDIIAGFEHTHGFLDIEAPESGYILYKIHDKGLAKADDTLFIIGTKQEIEMDDKKTVSLLIAECEWVKTILPKHYTCEPRDNGVHCYSNEGMEEDGEQWFFIFEAIKQKYGERFMEVFAQTSHRHKKFTIYLRPNEKV